MNDNIVSAFDRCINADGFHVWLERTYDPHVFKFAARFNPPTATAATATISSFKPTANVVCEDKPTKVSRAIWRTHCSRKDDKPVSLIVIADWNPAGGGNLTLPEITRVEPPPPPPPPPALDRLNPLFVGLTPNCNAGIITTHQGHLNCSNVPYGYTIKAGPAAQQLLYIGVTPNVNAGVVTIKSNFRGGATQEWGYTIRDQYKLPNSAPLYVVIGCGNNDGEVTNFSGHKNCPTAPIGWAALLSSVAQHPHAPDRLQRASPASAGR